ncbi:coiled-coil domain-containing protein 8 [Psammomys obesus]|uniref:coiled-coil domain-containing protein 8 n=1 Tax=Psammomys obesus TaxID=48139 RepID=UPI002452BA6C|nr:coiled-coil domain-containing protein 8 [Psammomys obesus]
MLQIGEDVDYLLIPREVRLAGGVWRVISKPATKEAEFRERLLQFLQEEGRTLEDVTRIIEKNTPHPPQPPKKSKERRVRRVPQMVTPPPRLVIGTYDSSNASDSELSDFETSKVKGSRGPQRTRKVRKMPVSYLGSKFLGSDVDSEDDEELVEAFLRRGEKKPSAPPPRRRINLSVPMFENLGPQPSKADRWREYVSQVSWGKLKQTVKGWAPRSGEAQQASSMPERARDLRLSRSTSQDQHSSRSTGDGINQTLGTSRWTPKIKWVSLRRFRKEQAPSQAQGTGMPAEGPPEAAENQGPEVPAEHGTEAAANPRGEAAANQRAEAAANPRGEAAANPRGEAAANPRGEAAANQRAEVLPDQRAEAIEASEGPANREAGAGDNQRVEAPADQRVGVLHDQREEAGPQATPEASAGSGSRVRKQVKTVRFQTPGHFSWFCKRRRAFWHSPRLPTLPKRVPKTGEARSLRVLRPEARAEMQEREQEEEL